MLVDRPAGSAYIVETLLQLVAPLSVDTQMLSTFQRAGEFVLMLAEGRFLTLLTAEQPDPVGVRDEHPVVHDQVPMMQVRVAHRGDRPRSSPAVVLVSGEQMLQLAVAVVESDPRSTLPRWLLHCSTVLELEGDIGTCRVRQELRELVAFAYYSPAEAR